MSATFRTLFALWFGFALAAPVERACAQQGKDQPQKPSPLKMRFVAKQACLVCGRKHSDPHHLSFAQPRALGRKVSDEFVVPLCRIHHRAVHRVSDERAWWKQAGIEPVQIARQLWANTRLDHDSLRPSLTKEPAEPGAASRPEGPAGKTSAG